MRKLLPAAALLVLLPVVALAAGGINLATGTRKEFTNCSSSGSSAQTLTAGTYLMRVTDKDSFVCLAASASTCSSDGEKFPMGTVMLVTINSDQVSVSCRSSDSTGDVIFTSAN